MTVLRLGPGGAEHACVPPVRDGVDWPALPVGSLWRCDLDGHVFIVVWPPEVHSGMQRCLPMWRRATWTERRRAEEDGSLFRGVVEWWIDLCHGNVRR